MYIKWLQIFALTSLIASVSSSAETPPHRMSDIRCTDDMHMAPSEMGIAKKLFSCADVYGIEAENTMKTYDNTMSKTL